MPLTDLKENQPFRDVPVYRYLKPKPIAFAVAKGLGKFIPTISVEDHQEREFLLWKEPDGKGGTRIKRETFKQLAEILKSLGPEDIQRVMSDRRFARWHRRQQQR